MANALVFQEVTPSRRQDTFAIEVCKGLSRVQKTLPSRFFYDAAGSELFEQITKLPEYYLTRCEQSIFEAHAGEMVAAAGANLAMIEFGSGSSEKTRLLLSAALSSQKGLVYVPIDISGDFLRSSAKALLEEYDGLHITALASEYNDAVNSLPSHSGPRLILFLGSNIGNFDQVEASDFLRRLRGVMHSEDRILVGIDLMKDVPIIERAYDDAQGVTAAFNKNILRRINRELGGHFDLDLFAHEAPFVSELSGIEMQLVSKVKQRVSVDALGTDFSFAEGEWIHTEHSHKWTMSGFERLCAGAGLKINATWGDDRGWYAVTLLSPDSA